MKYKFKENVELDAKMVFMGMRSGIDAVMGFGMAHKDEFPTPDHVMARGAWLKKQSEEYIKKVSEKASELTKLAQHGKNPGKNPSNMA